MLVWTSIFSIMLLTARSNGLGSPFGEPKMTHNLVSDSFVQTRRVSLCSLELVCFLVWLACLKQMSIIILATICYLSQWQMNYHSDPIHFNYIHIYSTSLRHVMKIKMGYYLRDKIIGIYHVPSHCCGNFEMHIELRDLSSKIN